MMEEVQHHVCQEQNRDCQQHQRLPALIRTIPRVRQALPVAAFIEKPVKS